MDKLTESLRKRTCRTLENKLTFMKSIGLIEDYKLDVVIDNVEVIDGVINYDIHIKQSITPKKTVRDININTRIDPIK